MIGLNAYILVDGVWTDASAILDNGVGTPVASAAANFDGRGISDIYELAFSSVVPGVSATVKVTCRSTSNPYDDQVGTSVDLDGATAYSDIVPGVDLVFSDDAGFGSTWEASVTVGNPFGAFNAFPPDSGEPSDGVRVKVVNSGSAAGTDCKARLLPVLKRVKMTGVVMAGMHPSAEGATEKLSGEQVAPYGLSAFNVSGSGAAKIMDLHLDGAPFDAQNLTDQTIGSTAFNVVDWYRAISGPLTGMEFKLSEDAVNGDSENVLCFSQRFSQTAPDQSGVPGDWGIGDLVLTEDGQDDGTISAAGAAYFWLRVLVVDGGNSSSNPYAVDVALEGTAEESAGWED